MRGVYGGSDFGFRAWCALLPAFALVVACVFGLQPAHAQSIQWTFGMLSPRTGQAAVYDSAHHVTFLHGGAGSGGIGDDTWEWNGARWTQRPPAGAPSR